MNSSAHQHNWSSVPSEQLNPSLIRQLVSGDQAMIARIQLAKGCIVPLHSHPNEQIATVISGALLFRLNDPSHPDEFLLRAGDLLVIPGDVPHSAEALEDTINLDIFSPPRHDWLAGDDAYLRQTPNESMSE